MRIHDKRGARTTNLWALLSIVLLGLTIASCEGGGGGGILGGGEGDSCTENSDCNSGYYCRGPNQPNACGIPPREFCASDTDCSMGTVCHVIFDSCSSDGLGSECLPPCTAMSCGQGLRCNAAGACETIPCDEGFTCPDRQRCDSAVAHASVPVSAQTNGCVNITCSNDTACPAGKFCVTGYCQDGEGSCREDIAVP
ncbi:MAG TPA: hypothetical protein PK156_37830 [Polyangium sp.]|nr:hypothetical protein [Polyangium sp.]